MNINIKKPYLVINTVGEPGVGKSTLSFWLMHELKKAGIESEYVPEVVKYDCFTEDGRKRVVSGDYDERYFSLQKNLIEPMLGNVQVLVNDGCYENFSFYSKRKMTSGKQKKFQKKIDSANEELHKKAEVLFVMPSRGHTYEEFGRTHNEIESDSIRSEIINSIGKEKIDFINNFEDKILFFEKIIRKLAEASEKG